MFQHPRMVGQAHPICAIYSINVDSDFISSPEFFCLLTGHLNFSKVRVYDFLGEQTFAFTNACTFTFNLTASEHKNLHRMLNALGE